MSWQTGGWCLHSFIVFSSSCSWKISVCSVLGDNHCICEMEVASVFSSKSSSSDVNLHLLVGTIPVFSHTWAWTTLLKSNSHYVLELLSVKSPHTCWALTWGSLQYLNWRWSLWCHWAAVIFSCSADIYDLFLGVSPLDINNILCWCVLLMCAIVCMNESLCISVCVFVCLQHIVCVCACVWFRGSIIIGSDLW